jgi:hypothetical protein
VQDRPGSAILVNVSIFHALTLRRWCDSESMEDDEK